MNALVEAAVTGFAWVTVWVVVIAFTMRVCFITGVMILALTTGVYLTGVLDLAVVEDEILGKEQLAEKIKAIRSVSLKTEDIKLWINWWKFLFIMILIFHSILPDL